MPPVLGVMTSFPLGYWRLTVEPRFEFEPFFDLPDGTSRNVAFRAFWNGEGAELKFNCVHRAVSGLTLEESFAGKPFGGSPRIFLRVV